MSSVSSPTMLATVLDTSLLPAVALTSACVPSLSCMQLQNAHLQPSSEAGVLQVAFHTCGEL